MSTYLITGAAGFIGFNLANHLLKSSQTVIALDNLIQIIKEGIQVTINWYRNQTIPQSGATS